ncbi:MGDG synthase family glycosyltransferase [Geminisphaera colitermitum]|uniref:MGDG synthase family glycosyltransferase n=1 Tax=Geminisphaera colitermitum TaxID=1148786 RepID=UPI0009DE2AA6|nr:glycosyltransferase [Geminisphaera colitermitum]
MHRPLTIMPKKPAPKPATAAPAAPTTTARTAGPILILHATAGAGHTRAAQAIAAALDLEHGSPGHRLVDTLDCTPTLFRGMYVKAYIELVQRAPEIWGYLYDKSDRTPDPRSRSARLRLAFDKLNSRSFRQLLDDTAPSAIVCTHFLPLELLSDLKRRDKIKTPVHAVITDVSPHSFWVYPHIDAWHVATPAAARELARKGIDSARIHVTGIPVDPVFEQHAPPAVARARLDLPQRPTILLLSGGFGVGPMKELLSSFTSSTASISLVVVAGRNATLETQCREIADTLPVPIRVHGFVNNMHEFMDAADLIVTKPGGLTTTEILAKGKPMVLVSPIPGQEQRNCEYLLEEGAAVRLYDTSDAAWHLENWLADAPRMRRMHMAARAIARPSAARTIARSLIDAAITP